MLKNLVLKRVFAQMSKKHSKKEEKPIKSSVLLLMNFALLLSIINLIGLLPYAYMKSLFNYYYYIVSILLVIAYIAFWKWKVKDERIRTCNFV